MKEMALKLWPCNDVGNKSLVPPKSMESNKQAAIIVPHPAVANQSKGL